MAKKKKTKTSSKSNTRAALKRFFTNKTNHTVFGIFLIFLSVFLIGAFISYLFNWQEDQSDLNGGFFELMGRPDYKVKNVLGKLGAAVSHQFIYRWFGIAAFLVPWFLILMGLRISMHIKLVRLRRQLGGIIFMLLWFPAAIAYLASSYPVLAGATGFFTLQWLTSLAGYVGSAAVLVFTMLIFLAIRFKWTPERINAFFANLSLPAFSRAEETSPDSGLDEAQPTPEEDNVDERQPLEVDFDDDEPEQETETGPEHQNEPLIIEQVEKEASHPPLVSDDENFEIEEKEEEQELSESEINNKLKEFGEYDPKLDLSKFKLPPIDLLREFQQSGISINQEELEENKNKIVETLNNYNIEISKIKATIGPTVTLYEIVPAAGVRISKIKNLEDDIALSLAALGIRIIAPIPGKGTIGIEVPNTNPQVVAMRNMLKGEKFQKTDMELPIAFGKTISNETLMADLTKMPHLLMAGATGQGKSVGLNVILTSILYKKHPSQVKFILVDPKKVELTLFNIQ